MVLLLKSYLYESAHTGGGHQCWKALIWASGALLLEELGPWLLITSASRRKALGCRKRPESKRCRGKVMEQCGTGPAPEDFERRDKAKGRQQRKTEEDGEQRRYGLVA